MSNTPVYCRLLKQACAAHSVSIIPVPMRTAAGRPVPGALMPYVRTKSLWHPMWNEGLGALIWQQDLGLTMALLKMGGLR